MSLLLNITQPKMKKLYAAICLTLSINTQLAAQKINKNVFYCGYTNNINTNALCSFFKSTATIPNKNAENAVDKILSPLGLPRNFVLVPCTHIKNAVAVTAPDGIRYIIYDDEFMQSIDRTTTNWSSVSILAHEIGHHLCGHTLVETADLPDSRRKELVV